MIKASELRKGNLVEYPFIGIMPIRSGADIDGVFEAAGMPIPITPEWLGRCGFEKTTALVDRYEIPFKDSGHIFMNEGETILKIEVEYIPIELEHIKYVHQLQNLYLDLTGDELKIEL